MPKSTEIREGEIMAELFESTSIGRMKLANRFVRSGTWTGMATEDGFMTPKLKELIANVAKGGVGLIVSDFLPVLKSGQSGPRQLGIYDDAQMTGLAEMVDAVHAAGAKIVAQVVHGGTHSNPQFTGMEPMGPSAMSRVDGKSGFFPGCREMMQGDIDSVVEGFRLAAIRAKKAGFDGIQLHCAHGYLLSQFLSPLYNKRTDQYGGSVANRARIVVEIYNQVRKEVGAGYPILVKMNVTDFLDGGISADEAFQTATIFAKVGIDAIELSGGTGLGFRVFGDWDRTPMRKAKDEGYYRDMAKRLKAELQVPIVLTGGIRRYQTAEQFVRNSVADYIGLCRPLIRKPGLINRWESGDTRESDCISDNGCYFAAVAGKDLQCVRPPGQQ
jgi:2,4-dienoyl-CoA reductase-like NADH-dependent reductase (Old Yellow Enzyme family)